MELHLMALAILVLTLVAAYAIRRAEEDMIEHRDPDRRSQKGPSAQHSHEAASVTKVAT